MRLRLARLQKNQYALIPETRWKGLAFVYRKELEKAFSTNKKNVALDDFVEYTFFHQHKDVVVELTEGEYLAVSGTTFHGPTNNKGAHDMQHHVKLLSTAAKFAATAAKKRKSTFGTKNTRSRKVPKSKETAEDREEDEIIEDEKEKPTTRTKKKMGSKIVETTKEGETNEDEKEDPATRTKKKKGSKPVETTKEGETNEDDDANNTAAMEEEEEEKEEEEDKPKKTANKRKRTVVITDDKGDDDEEEKVKRKVPKGKKDATSSDEEDDEEEDEAKKKKKKNVKNIKDDNNRENKDGRTAQQNALVRQPPPPPPPPYGFLQYGAYFYPQQLGPAPQYGVFVPMQQPGSAQQYGAFNPPQQQQDNGQSQQQNANPSLAYGGGNIMQHSPPLAYHSPLPTLGEGSAQSDHTKQNGPPPNEPTMRHVVVWRGPDYGHDGNLARIRAESEHDQGVVEREARVTIVVWPLRVCTSIALLMLSWTAVAVLFSGGLDGLSNIKSYDGEAMREAFHETYLEGPAALIQYASLQVPGGVQDIAESTRIVSDILGKSDISEQETPFSKEEIKEAASYTKDNRVARSNDKTMRKMEKAFSELSVTKVMSMSDQLRQALSEQLQKHDDRKNRITSYQGRTPKYISNFEFKPLKNQASETETDLASETALDLDLASETETETASETASETALDLDLDLASETETASETALDLDLDLDLASETDLDSETGGLVESMENLSLTPEGEPEKRDRGTNPAKRKFFNSEKFLTLAYDPDMTYETLLYRAVTYPFKFTLEYIATKVTTERGLYEYAEKAGVPEAYSDLVKDVIRSFLNERFSDVERGVRFMKALTAFLTLGETGYAFWRLVFRIKQNIQRPNSASSLVGKTVRSLIDTAHFSLSELPKISIAMMIVLDLICMENEELEPQRNRIFEGGIYMDVVTVLHLVALTPLTDVAGAIAYAGSPTPFKARYAIVSWNVLSFLCRAFDSIRFNGVSRVLSQQYSTLIKTYFNSWKRSPVKNIQAPPVGAVGAVVGQPMYHYYRSIQDVKREGEEDPSKFQAPPAGVGAVVGQPMYHYYYR